MDREYVYEDEQYDEGLTFAKIGKFFQTAWLRILIYLVAAALLVTAVALPIKVFYKSEPIAKTSIEYIYDGIEKGQAPDETSLNTDNIISPTVLSNAVSEANLGKIIKDISSLRSAMRVEAVVTDEYLKLAAAAANGDSAAANTLRNYNMFPTRFDIVISDPAKLGLSDDQAKLLLNKIVTCYYDDFQNRYSLTKVFAESMYNLSQSGNLEFTEIYDIYLQALGSVKAYLQELSDKFGNFTSPSNNTTFATLLSEVNVLNSGYNQFNAYIISNNIWMDRQAAKSALEASKLDVTNKLEPLEAYIKALAEQIKNIQPNTVTTESNGTQSVTVFYPEEYYVYQSRLDESNRQVREYSVQLKNIETRLEKLEAAEDVDPALKTQASSMLAELEGQTLDLVKKVNATIADYYDTFVSSSVRQVQTSIVTRKSASFNILIVYVIGFIVALFVACIVTAVKNGKAKSARKSSAQAAPAEQKQEPTEQNN